MLGVSFRNVGIPLSALRSMDVSRVADKNEMFGRDAIIGKLKHTHSHFSGDVSALGYFELQMDSWKLARVQCEIQHVSVLRLRETVSEKFTRQRKSLLTDLARGRLPAFSCRAAFPHGRFRKKGVCAKEEFFCGSR